MDINVTLQLFQELEQLNLLSKTSPSMTAAQKWQSCTAPNVPCPAGQTDADSCCLFHVNVHSCQNKPGLFCGPWVGNDGQLATHTPAQTGFVNADGKSVWEFVVKLFWEGSYTVIGHVKMAGFHFAIGIPTEVQYGASACSDPFQVPSRQGPCMHCPAGTQPLSQGIPPGATQLSDDEALATGQNPLCIVCPPGMASPDGRLCTKCDPGTYAQAGGSIACQDCAPGRYAYEDGSHMCRVCLAGSYAGPRSMICASCPRGRYRPAPASHANITDRGDETDCLACPHPYTTLDIHAKNITQCVCPEGSYELPASQGVAGLPGCATCTAGMQCLTGGLSAPLQVEGYFVQPIDQSGEYEAYRCLAEHCPAGSAGTCREGRQGLACAECEPFYYPDKDGKCSACEGQDIMPAVLVVVVLGGGLCLLFIWAGVDAARQRLNTLGLLCIVGQVVVTVQLVASISMMQFKLVDPLKSLADSMTVINLDVDTVKLQCVFGYDTSIGKYATTLAAYPFVAVCLCMVFGILRCVTKRQLSIWDVMNSLGLLLMVLFLPVTVVCLQPFRCVSNPSGHSSVSAAASVLCGESEHKVMLAIGSLGTLLYPVAVLGSVTTITWFYPRLVAVGKDAALLRSCRFLYQRFTPKAYYYGLVYLLRSTLVALLPVAFPDPSYYLPFCLTTTVVAVALLQAKFWPWRTELSNINDAACGFFLVMVLAVTNALADLERGVLEKQLSVILTISIALGAAIVLITLIVGVGKVLRRFQKRYGIFLTHHKAGAGCLARLIKMRLQPLMRSGSEVFLDADNLDDLESLFDTVRCDVAHLLAILTEETLRRPWCAGELVTAFKNGVPVTIATYPGLQLPDGEELENFCHMWSPEDLHPLHAVGVQESDVVDCYRKLAALPRISMPRSLATKDDLLHLDQAIAEVARVCCGPRVSSDRMSPRMSQSPTMRASRTASRKDSEDSLVIIVNVIDPEAVASAFILQELMRASAHQQPLIVSQPEDIEEAKTAGAICIVILSKGCLESPDFMRPLLAAQGKWSHKAAIISVMADKAFSFPSKEDVVKKLSPTMARVLAKNYGSESSPEHVNKCYSAVLQILALELSCQLSMEILITQVAMIHRRVEKAQAQLVVGAVKASVAKLMTTASPRGEEGQQYQSPRGGQKRTSLIGNMLELASLSPRDLSRDRMKESASHAPVSMLGGPDDDRYSDNDRHSDNDVEEGERAI